ncbi:GyrI-like domain-containing protein [Microbacterium album]|nr:GyrI-like domain-containing protein [Microbacterium album]
MTDKVDFTKALDAYRAPRGAFRVVEVPELRYLMVDGRGDPNTAPAFVGAIEALYPVAYRLKFASKRELGRDYVVPPLEGLWWSESMDAFTTARDKSRWEWTLMILVPDWIDPELIARAIAAAGEKRPPARLGDVRVDALSEGTCLQSLHVGSFDDEGGVLERLHREATETRGMRLAGKHHEIYLSDFRRVTPERQRTILRQPVTP